MRLHLIVKCLYHHVWQKTGYDILIIAGLNTVTLTLRGSLTLAEKWLYHIYESYDK